MNERQMILVVDDSETDLDLMRLAFERAKIANPVRELENGEMAIDYLAGAGIYGNRTEHPMPGVVLLDLNMPRKNGFEVLRWVSAQPALTRLPIYVMTASLRPEDVEDAFNLGATGFLVKPASFEDLVSMMRTWRDWLDINHFPPQNEAVKRLGS